MSQRRFLERVARAVWLALSPRKAGLGLRMYDRAWRKTGDSDTGGWSVRIGVFRRERTYLEIWFDRFPGYHRQRKLWFGLYSTKTKRLEQVAARCRMLGKPQTVGWDEIVRNTDTGEWRLKRKFTRVDFKRPMLENYGGESGFYGKYLVSAGKPQTGRFGSVVNTIVDFYELVAEQLAPERKFTADDEVYTAYENRRVVRGHLARERAPELARQRKRQDGYRCQICGMTFLEVHGDIGRGFAEAHHIVPLAKLRRRTRRTVEDLITVCPNCHSMLHRMDGTPDDVGRLRKILRSR